MFWRHNNSYSLKFWCYWECEYYRNLEFYLCCHYFCKFAVRRGVQNVVYLEYWISWIWWCHKQFDSILTRVNCEIPALELGGFYFWLQIKEIFQNKTVHKNKTSRVSFTYSAILFCHYLNNDNTNSWTCNRIKLPTRNFTKY